MNVIFTHEILLFSISFKSQKIQPDKLQTLKDYRLTIEYKHLKQNAPGGVFVIPSVNHLRIWYGVIFVRRGHYANGIFKFRYARAGSGVHVSCVHPKAYCTECLRAPYRVLASTKFSIFQVLAPDRQIDRDRCCFRLVPSTFIGRITSFRSFKRCYCCVVLKLCFLYYSSPRSIFLYSSISYHSS